MSYKVFQKIIEFSFPVERIILHRATSHAKRSVVFTNPQLVIAYNGFTKRKFCLSKVLKVEEVKPAEGEQRQDSFSGGQDEFSQKVKQDRMKEERETKEDDEDESIRDSILSASLPFVLGYGWSKQAVEAGTESLGHPTITAGVISDPGIALIHHHYQMSNDLLIRLMKQEVEEVQASGQELKITPFLKRSIEKRLKMNIPYMSRWAEALAIMTYPQNAPTSLNLGLELVDSMWHVVGDKEVDLNWYSKRLTLLGVYKSTELAMMQDKSEGYLDTWSFLDRRFDDAKNIKELLGAPEDAIKIIGAVGSTVQAFLGVKR